MRNIRASPDAASLRAGASLYYSPMSINSIPHRNKDELDLHHLQVLDVLLREHSLTRAAKVLSVTQPALCKTLARLRRYFHDPLFVRVALRMEPTPKALELKAPVGAILDQMRRLKQRARAVRSAGLQPHLQLLRGRRRRDQAACRRWSRCSPSRRRTCGCARCSSKSQHLEFLARVGQDRFRHGLVSRAGEGNPPPAAMGRALRERRAQRPSANFGGRLAQGLRGGEARAGLDGRHRPRASIGRAGARGRDPAGEHHLPGADFPRPQPSWPSTPTRSPRCPIRSRRCWRRISISNW